MSEDRTREAINKTARDIRTQAEKSGRPMTQSEARTIVSDARARGDRIRDNRNR